MADYSQFRDAVDELIGTSRNAPMFPEISEALQRSRNRAMSPQPLNSGLSEVSPGVYGVLKVAARNSKLARPEYVAECLKLIRDKTMGKLTLHEFTQSLELLQESSDKTQQQ